MTRTKLESQPKEIQELTRRLQEAKQAVRAKRNVTRAKETLNGVIESFMSRKDSVSTVEEIYNLCKEVFFKVNGANRVLKNE